MNKVKDARYKDITARSILYAVLVIVALYYLAPLFLMILTSFRSMDEIRVGQLIEWPKSFSFDAWHAAWNQVQIGARDELGLQPYFMNSIRMVIPSVLLSTLFGALNGYVISFWKFRGSELFFALLLAGCFLPFQAILLPHSIVLGKMGLSGSTTGLVFTHVVYGVAFTTLFFRNYYVNLPGELIKAAKLDGAGFWMIFYRIILPISTPILVVSIIWQFTQIWNDFLFGVVFSDPSSQPITVGLNNMVNSTTGDKRYNIDMAGAIIAALPTIFVYVVAGKYFVRGLTAGSVKG
ncbi:MULTISPECIES: carbohydrate ABC transporter permease [Reinekea]|jgi:glucose/mannose transport system permease protein|uniref:ABC-type sugar transport system, permease component n=1 Tax=Reinekea forsetii TaxID=1336806 RepID=A0A2K8KP78_9GAMM|nr:MULTISPECIES: carbohydrate ABC transporter permease [Reinekea]ATX75681.1 ABC-type sugar transport system, permease component [Reinekea forsetii]MDO7641743.1 carbohydrate ABC transporter permease [Reinekea forsetii]MDO7645233.1 carbohydrate ABC transporter permease [Reinekea forsetii]